MLCLCEVWVWILCVDGRSRYLCIVLGGYLHIWGAPSVQSCCTLWISAFWHVFVYGRYHKSRLSCLKLSDLDWSRHHPLLWAAAPAIQRVRMAGMPKKLVCYFQFSCSWTHAISWQRTEQVLTELDISAIEEYIIIIIIYQINQETVHKYNIYMI